MTETAPGIFSTEVFNSTADTYRVTANLFNGEEMSNIDIQQSVNRANTARVVLEGSRDSEVNITSLRVELRMCRKGNYCFLLMHKKEKWKICFSKRLCPFDVTLNITERSCDGIHERFLTSCDIKIARTLALALLLCIAICNGSNWQL